MRTIVVSGQQSGIGKTYTAERLLSRLRNWSALKVTVNKGAGCPRNERKCGICRGITEPFRIIKSEKIINQRGKDTDRLKKAGAKQVIWLKARPEGLKSGLKKALSEFRECSGVVIEGTSVLRFIKPDINIHLYDRQF